MSEKDDERAALVVGLRKPPLSLARSRTAADLIEADGKLLALADAAPHGWHCAQFGMVHPDHYGVCDCWKADYDAAKDALS